MRPLDIVRTPKGAIAIVSEMSGDSAFITYCRNQPVTWEKSAWWSPDEGLVVLDSLPAMLADMTAHNSGSNTSQGNIFRERKGKPK